jgi:thiol-disulfide isomerase/thioredoxin
MIRKVVWILLVALAGARVSMAQTAEMIKLPALQSLIESRSDQIKVINFWATWCAPCVKELPLFEKLNEERKDVRVMLVSMDIDLDPDPEKVRKFILRKKMLAQIYILNEQHPDAWITKIDKNWSGALPATLFINTTTGKRQFVEREIHEGELEKIIDSLK